MTLGALDYVINAIKGEISNTSSCLDIALLTSLAN